ncbi:MAG: sigma-70 family RNA polymerase sigma factor [Clostridia bacterium]|nr:sigma-70 family RNA polymerase sigma factor [Clostridia bacterium]
MHSEFDILLESVKNGDRSYFDVIYSRYKPLVESLTQKYGKKYSLPEVEFNDIKQEALIALFYAIWDYRPNEEVTFGMYAKVCIRNRIISYIRCFLENDVPLSLEEMENDWEEQPDFLTPEHIVISKESLCTLNRRIDEALTDFEKSVFALYIGDMSYADMAEKLGKPTKSIDNAIHRIKAKLRKLL